MDAAQASRTNSHYESDGQKVPENVAKALAALQAASGKRRKTADRSTDLYHALLWRLGDAIGEACWLKGHAAGIRRKAPAERRIRVDLSLTELLQLSWLSHLGFQHMMPNYRGFEIHRFSGEQDAQKAQKPSAGSKPQFRQRTAPSPIFPTNSGVGRS
jgi:hypothetical protein